jgi:hypothetical protein
VIALVGAIVAVAAFMGTRGSGQNTTAGAPDLRATSPEPAPSSVPSATLGLATNAEATPTLADKATAQALFEDALQLMGAKRYREACPKLEESERLDPALGTRFRLSECDEAVGRLASAWAGFLEVADLAHGSGQTDRENVARARAASIEPKLSRVITTSSVAGSGGRPSRSTPAPTRSQRPRRGKNPGAAASRSPRTARRQASRFLPSTTRPPRWLRTLRPSLSSSGPTVRPCTG